MKWFHKPKYKTVRNTKAKPVPTGQWIKCPSCKTQIRRKELADNLWVCKCGFHHRIGAKDRLKIIIDKGTFREKFSEISTADPLKFSDAKGSYALKVKKTIKKLGINEGIIIGSGRINTIPVVIGIMDFKFLGGSMGSAVGEKVYKAMQLAIKQKKTLIIVSQSGGARMHEGILSLLQMAKTCAGLELMEEKGIPFISVLTDPTTGGVTASFASMGDIIIAEPGALIGFAGPRVIEQNIKQKLPEGFQRAEFLQEHGFVDCISSRSALKDNLTKFLIFFNN
ncbi:MAG TPA: acetyl-CoA carboxylase, carboxyltransferase subunit beta [Spirochaetota bacterium]|nr:acetyl-CoA carboxylase, carboxyltransferase subunit beta [Spirochaetota bacterium]